MDIISRQNHRRAASRRRPGAVRLGVEALEQRTLLAAPVLDAIPPQTVPAGKTLMVPVTAADLDGNPITYSVTSSNPQVGAEFRKSNNPFLKISVANFGDMVFQLFNDLTPNTVSQIGKLVNSGFYNNLTFHRVVPNFVIQGGDPKGDGTGGPGFTFNDEFNPQAIFSGNGQLAMANSGKDTNGSQFFVTIGQQRFLDFNHTIFGQLVRGFDVLNKIDAVPTDANSKPLTPVVISSATIVPDPTDGVLTLNAAAGTAGQTSTVTVTADDGKGGQTPQTFTAQVAADSTNDPPILGSVSDQTTTAGTPVTFSLSGTDLENDPLTFEAKPQDTPANATVSVNGSNVTVTPNAGFTGAIHLLVGVADQGATSRGSSPDPFDTQTIAVNVNAATPNPNPNPNPNPTPTPTPTSGGQPATETFNAPDLSDLLQAAANGENTAPAAIKRMVDALQAQLNSGPLADLNAGRVDGTGFGTEVADLVNSYKQNVAQQLEPDHPNVANRLMAEGDRIRADVDSLNQQIAVGLNASSTLGGSAQSAITALAPQPKGGDPLFRAVVTRTRAFEGDLNTLVASMAATAAPQLTVDQVDTTLLAEAHAYREDMHSLLFGHSHASSVVDSALTDLEREVDAAAHGSSTPAGDAPTRIATAVKDFDLRVLDTNGFFGPQGEFGSRFGALGSNPNQPTGTTQPGTPTTTPTPTPTPASPPDATQAFLLTPVPDTATLAEHIHPHLTILINGQAQTIPGNIGFSNGFLPMHTHADSQAGETFKRIHIESPSVRTFHLRDFFTVWQKTLNDPNAVFTSQNILGHQVDATHQITMTVNGQPSTDFENLVLQDNGTLFDTDQPGTTDPRVQNIVISYGPK